MGREYLVRRNGRTIPCKAFHDRRLGYFAVARAAFCLIAARTLFYLRMALGKRVALQCWFNRFNPDASAERQSMLAPSQETNARYLRTVMTVTLCAIAAVVAVSTRYSRAAVPPQAPKPGQLTSAGAPQSPQIISAESNVVNVDVVVTDEDGRVLNALKKENFRRTGTPRA